MQRSKIEVFVHYVWTTKNRLFLTEPAMERGLNRTIGRETVRLKCKPLAFGAMPDHVHVVVKMHSTVAVASLAQAMKGVASKMLNADFSFENGFDWQDRYGAFSVGRGDELQNVLAYVRRQKEHHAQGDVWSEWEEAETEEDW